MLETLQRSIKTLLTQVRARVVARSIAPAALIFVAFAVSLVALPLFAKEYYAAGFAIFVLGRSISVLAVTADEGADPGGSVPPLVLDCIAWASVPFGFALADPTRAVAASFLLFGFVAVSSASLEQKRLRRLDAVVCVAAFATICFAPAWFGVIAYGLGIACFGVTGLRLTWRAV